MAIRADDVDLGRDRDLVQRYQNGDPEAFDDLYRRYFDRLSRYCRRHTSNHHEAEEVAQEAFVRALSSMDRLEGERRFYPWMTVIARRISIDRHRRDGRLELTDEPDVGTVDPDHEHLFAAVDAAQVQEAMEQLGPRHREVLLLREAEGLAYADIAERLDVPMTTVEALLHRARKALRREYAKVTAGDGFLGIPIFGVLGAKLGRLRARIGDHWVEAATVAAPVAVGAVTAAVVLAPSGASTPAEETSAPMLGRAPIAQETTTTTPDPAAPVTVAIPAPAPTTTATSTPTSTTSEPPAPTVDAGPVDVFLGPDAERAREEAERMPVGGSAGPAAAGADPVLTAEDVAEFLDDVRHVLSGTNRPADAPDEPSVLDSILGKN